MKRYFTTEEWEIDLGRQVRAIRLRRNLDQRVLAGHAGVGLTALKNLESGKGAAIKTLIRVLRALERVDWLETLEPDVSVSPLQLLKARRTRQRATGTRRLKEPTDG